MTPEKAAREWCKSLGLAKKIGSIPASDTYSGAHWKESPAAEENGRSSGYNSELWVLSAGYSLIKASDEIVPYSASFSPGEDSIHNLDWPKDFSTSQPSYRRLILPH